jgi:hypothetical protein
MQMLQSVHMPPRPQNHHHAVPSFLQVFVQVSTECNFCSLFNAPSRSKGVAANRNDQNMRAELWQHLTGGKDAKTAAAEMKKATEAGQRYEPPLLPWVTRMLDSRCDASAVPLFAVCTALKVGSPTNLARTVKMAR